MLPCSVCAAALLLVPLASCATSSAPPAGTSWELRHYTFEPMSDAKQAELRRAFDECARVELAFHWVHGNSQYHCSDKNWKLVQYPDTPDSPHWPRSEWVRELTPGPELEAIRTKLAAVPQWYTPVFDKRVHVHPSAGRCIRFLDAEGKVLYSEWHSYGPWTSCAGEQGERVALISFFPAFPARSSFTRQKLQP